MLDLNTLYCKFIELKECSNIRDEWKDEYREFFKEQYKLYGNGARGFVKKSFVRKKLTEVYPDEWLYFVSTLQSKYEFDGVGLKLMAREIGISYTKMRRLLEYTGIPIRKGYSVVTEHLRKIRRANAIASGGWRNKKTKNKNTERGVQGYFFNQSKQKYVWLRSTYEVILAKWLDKNKMNWAVESQQWMIGTESYRPDFFIYENNELVKIIEVKGYYKNRLWKFDELKKEPSLQNVEFCLIDNITPFLDGNTYLGELKWWKQNRLLKLES
jgi:hypothetical protein